MSDWNGILIIAMAALVIILLVILLAAAGKYRDLQSEDWIKAYRQYRRDFLSRWRAFQRTPFVSWKGPFPRGEPFTSNDQQIAEVAQRARKARSAFVDLPGRLWSPGEGTGPVDALLDIHGNLERLRRWAEDQEMLSKAARLAEEMDRVTSDMEELIQNEAGIRRRVVEGVALLQQEVEQAASKPPALDGERDEQVGMLLAQAHTAQRRAAEALQSGDITGPSAKDDGVQYALAHLAAQIARLCLGHIEVMGLIAAETVRVEEETLFEQFGPVCLGCVGVASAPMKPDWTSLAAEWQALNAHQPRLEAIRRELQRRVDASQEYWDSLNAFVKDMRKEIERVEDTEQCLISFLGDINKVPQTWEEITGEVGRLSEAMKALHRDLEAQTRMEGARRVDDTKWEQLHAERDRFLRMKSRGELLKNRLVLLNSEINKLKTRYDPGGSAARVMAMLQESSRTCPAEYQPSIENLMAEIDAFRQHLNPHPGWHYGLLSERLDRLVNRGHETLALCREMLDEQKDAVATEQTKIRDLCSRYERIRARKPRVEKDWSEVEGWLECLSKFDLTQAGYEDCRTFTGACREELGTYDAEIRVVEQIYQDLDDRIRDIVGSASEKRNEVIRLAEEIEKSRWKGMFQWASNTLRNFAETYAQQINAAESAGSADQDAEAVEVLRQVQERIEATDPQVLDFIPEYEPPLNDLKNQDRYYQRMREQYIQKHGGQNTDGLRLSTADSYHAQAYQSRTVDEARASLIDAMKVLEGIDDLKRSERYTRA